LKPGRFTWVIVGAVVALVVFAGVDGLRSPNKATSESTTTGSTTTVEQTVKQASGRLPTCTRRQIAVSVEVREATADQQLARATVVVGRIGTSRCSLDGAFAEMRIKDRTGQIVEHWWRARLWLRSESLAASVPLEFPCERGGPFLALVKVVGLNPAPPNKLFRSEITC
jgi:hypothetical protein